METKVATTYANLVPSYLEEKLALECKTFFGEECALYIKKKQLVMLRKRFFSFFGQNHWKTYKISTKFLIPYITAYDLT